MNFFIAALLVSSIALIQCLIGGTRLVFSLPAYGILALAAIATACRRGAPGAVPDARALIVTGIAFSYILLRAVVSPVTYLWWSDFYMVLACLIVYLATAFFVHEPRARSLIVVGLLALAVAELFVGLRQFTRGDEWMPFGFIRAASARRASGMFISSIHLAGFLEAVGVVALAFAIWSKWKGWARFLAAYLGALCYFGVAITGSRGGYLSSVAALAALAGLSLFALRQVRPDRFRKRAMLAALAVVVAVGGGVALMRMDETLRTRLTLLTDQLERNKLDVRIYNWQAAIDQFRVNPLFGTGAGTHLYFGRFFRRAELQSDPVHAHSDYLELLAEYGIVGALLIAAFVFIHVRNGWQALGYLLRTALHDLAPYTPARDNRVALIIGALSAIAAYSVHSAVDFNLHIPGNALVFAFIFGVLASPVAVPEAPARRVHTAFRWAIPALGIAILFAGLPKLPGEYWCEKARIALRNRDFDAAIEFAEKGIAREKRNPELYFHLGEANRALAASIRVRQQRTPYFEAAVAAYKKGLQLFPQDENLWIRLGQALDGLRAFAEAESAYLTAINLDPNLSVLYTYYSVHLELRGRTEEAQEQLEKGRSVGKEIPPPSGSYRLAPPEKSP